MRQPSTLFLIATASLACNPAQDNQPIDMDPVGRISGQVTDVQGRPVQDVFVDAAGTTASTNADGLFTLEQVEPDSNIVLTYTADGYATTYSRVALLGWETATTEARMLEVDGVFELEADQESTIEVETPSGRVAVTFQGGGFENADGDTVVGTVIGALTFLDPSSEEFLAGPGDLQGQSTETVELMVSFGMVEVTLTEPDGSPVQLTDGLPATVEMPLIEEDKPDWMNTAPYTEEGSGVNVGDTQRMWSFDSDNGQWFEEGTGTIFADDTGKRHIRFEAPHFTWWNADDGRAAYCAEGRVVDVLGFPIRGARVLCIAEIPPFYCAFDGDLTDDCIPPNNGGGGGGDDRAAPEPFDEDPLGADPGVGTEQGWRDLNANSRSFNTVTTDANGYYSCEVWAGGNATFQASTYVANRRWDSAVHGQFIGGTTDDISQCEPIPTLQIDVCRITGVITVENMTSVTEDNKTPVDADHASAAFFEPKGDVEYCQNPWDFLSLGECETFFTEKLADFLPSSAVVGLPIDVRSVGNAVDLSTSSGQNVNLPFDSTRGVYNFVSEDANNNQVRPNFKDGDVLSVKAPGSSDYYFGPWQEDRFATVPRSVAFANNTSRVETSSRGVEIRYSGNTNFQGGVLAVANAANSSDATVCRFTDDGDIRIPAQNLISLEGGFGGLGIYHLDDSYAVGPDGLPIRLQLFSGASTSIEYQ